MNRTTDPALLLDSRTRKIIDASERVAESAVRVANELPARLRALTDAVNGGARSKPPGEGGGSGHSTIVFCEIHELDDCPCGQGTTYPAVTDTTGEAAAQRADKGDRAASDLDELESIVKQQERLEERKVRILERYGRRSATEFERGATSQTKGTTEGCGSCARIPSEADPKVGHYEPPEGPRPTDMGGLLETPMTLCSWCKRYVRAGGRLPSRAELKQRRAGERVKKSA